MKNQRMQNQRSVHFKQQWSRQINELTKAEHPYTWVQSGRYTILPTAKEKMQLSVAGITTANKLDLK